MKKILLTIALLSLMGCGGYQSEDECFYRLELERKERTAEIMNLAISYSDKVKKINTMNADLERRGLNCFN